MTKRKRVVALQCCRCFACNEPIAVGRLAICLQTFHATEDGTLVPTDDLPREAYAICSKDCAVAVLEHLTRSTRKEECAMKSKKKKPKKGY